LLKIVTAQKQLQRNLEEHIWSEESLLLMQRKHILWLGDGTAWILEFIWLYEKGKDEKSS
jgi:hypothetical protein